MGSAPRTSHVVRVAGRRDVGGEMALVAFDVPDELRGTYVRPGQYAHFSVSSDGGYFALGNREGRGPWEILVRRGGGVADVLHDAPVGLEVVATTALGSGFPVEVARGEDAVVIVTAAAMAAARSTVHRRIDDGDASATRLLVGARTRDSLPLRDEIETMRKAGVDVQIVLSRDESPREARYVQHALEREWAAHAWLFVAGADAMIADVRAAALALGARTDRIVSNA